jgi:hypothetical protein
MVVRVRRAIVIVALLLFGPPTVGVEERSVVVLVNVVTATVLERAERTAGVVVGHVVVVVGVNDAGMRMLVLDIIDDALHRLPLSHRPAPPQRNSDRGIPLSEARSRLAVQPSP